MKISNNLLGLLNILIFFVSIPIVYFGIIANKTHSGGECLDLFRKPFLVVGVFVMVMSIFGIIGGCCRVPSILWTYLAIMFLVLFAYFSVWIFAFFITWKPGGGTEIIGTGHKEFKLNRYTEWMQMRVQDKKNWKKIKHCLILGDYCPNLMPGNGTSLRDFNKVELAPVLSSCCKPSVECGFSYENPTVWKKKNNSASSNPDCKAWDNDRKVMCFNCESCKAGMLEQLIISWKAMHLFRTLMLGFLCFVYAVACCAFKNTREKF
ncbi:tetraspanin-8-like [Prunus avium]|uniref:Tetraspanin-8-like n=1 Tax=Prunus avium TaxID=42229 RepID=A0A6P5SPY9_PRUAV|nr:tetraspanin-8-like [Prunus avium]